MVWILMKITPLKSDFIYFPFYLLVYIYLLLFQEENPILIHTFSNLGATVFQFMMDTIEKTEEFKKYFNFIKGK